MSSQDTDREKQQYCEPTYALTNKKNEDYPFDAPSIDQRLTPEQTKTNLANKIRKLLEEYSHIPQEEQSKHVHSIRDQAFAIRAYPCTGLGVWLIPYISLSPAYATIVKRLQGGDSMVDIGCFVGGDFRRLVFNGAPLESMVGVDLVSHWEVGYELFRDREKFRARFVEADLMTVEEDSGLQKLKGKMDIIHISAVLHQWDWDAQVTAVKKLILLSKPGSLVVGHQIGNAQARHVQNPALKTLLQSRHDPASFKEMWRQAGEETGTKWETEAWLRSWEFMGLDAGNTKWMEPGDAILDFVVTRLS
ncbi:hypothetical protein LTR37_016754 [Vermiconidia calcicola]|uniref:Uncharacterized protein n=1 Tax=Vermiconidia calcicola TaxID=1690605 RepID=A0ACC3MNF6_9PEZI|nr:hypothetical protein LTR37_016754 [Vermiconidia calcicola]